VGRTVQGHNAEDEHEGENQNYNGIDLQSWAFIGVESYLPALAFVFLAVFTLHETALHMPHLRS